MSLDNVSTGISTGPIKDTPSATSVAAKLYENADYTPILSNWFTAKPYGFRFTPKIGDPVVMFLPIAPSNLTIVTNFATNITPTIYGTVEEHSPVRYYDITIEGTTGMGPKYTLPMGQNETPSAFNGSLKKGRRSFPVQLNLSQYPGVFSKTLKTVDKVVGDVANFFGGNPRTGLLLDQTGYAAFHNFYRFFMKYKKDASGTDQKNDKTTRAADAAHPLVFFNYKDNNEYKVAVKSFVLRRDKENPMLYNYSITMKGYDLGEINTNSGLQGVASQNEMLEALGLKGVFRSNWLSEMKRFATMARGVLGSVANGTNQLGR